MHTGGVIDLQILTTVLSVLAAFIGIAAYLHAIKQDLTVQITGIESRMTDRVDGVESHMTDRVDRLESSLTAKIDDVKTDVVDLRAAVRVLEQRTFEMVHRGTATDAGQHPT